MSEGTVIRRSVLEIAKGQELDRLGVAVERYRWLRTDDQLREAIRDSAKAAGRYEDDIFGDPSKPEREPTLAPIPAILLADDGYRMPGTFLEVEYIASDRVPPTLERIIAERVAHPLLEGEVKKDGSLVVTIPESQRVQDLLEACNLLLEQKREERRQHDRTRDELDVWKERALTYRAAIRRVDPVWLGEESP